MPTRRSPPRVRYRARTYAERKGWTVDPACIFVDDGISGADFVRREGRVRLMNTLKPRPPFQVLVMMEQSHLGRSPDDVPYALRRITEVGVRIFFSTSRSPCCLSKTDKVIRSAS